MSEIVILPRHFSGETTGHADLTVSFIDSDVLAFTDLTGNGHLKRLLQKSLGHKFKIVELNSVVVVSTDVYSKVSCIYRPKFSERMGGRGLIFERSLYKRFYSKQ